jgi:hypothetical protein
MYCKLEPGTTVKLAYVAMRGRRIMQGQDLRQQNMDGLLVFIWWIYNAVVTLFIP